MTKNDILEALRNECKDMNTKQARAHIEKKAGFSIVLTGNKPAQHYTVFYNGERIANIEGIRGIKGTRGANSAVTVTRRPRKVTATRATAAAVNVTRLALAYVNDLDKLFSDRAATKTNQAAEAVTALTAALRSGLYTAAADYLKKSLSEAKTAAATFERAADIVNRADALYHRYIDFNLYQAEHERARRAYDEQAAILSECETEAERGTMIKVLRRAGKYIETAPAPFARPVCEGLQAVTAADLVTAETVATFAAADRDRAAADLAEWLQDSDQVAATAARLDMTAADLATLFNATAAPTVAETAAEVATVTKSARKGRAKKTA